MKNTIVKLTFISSILLAFFSTSSYAQDEFVSDLVVSLSDPGKPGKLIVNFTNGSIKVTAYEGKEVLISASVIEDKYDHSHEWDSDCNCEDDEDEEKENDKKKGMTKLQNTRTTGLQAYEENNEVKVSAKTWQSPIALEVKVPKNFSAKLSTVNQGKIIIEGLEGDLEVKNVNNDIKATRIAGSISANTVNGDLTVELVSIDKNKPMAFSTLNGDIDVSFPKNIKALLNIQNDRGEIYTDFDVDLTRTKPEVQERRDGSVYKVTVENRLYGKINGGGSEVRFNTMNGDIYIRQGK